MPTWSRWLGSWAWRCRRGPTPSSGRCRKLDKLSGSAFDNAWISGQIVAHKKAKANGQRELTKGSNRNAVKVARTSAPIVAHHLDELMKLRSGRHSDHG